jgi:AcrR family transcriptional regulator
LPPSPRFTLREIQDHALVIVDQEGLGGLSMRALASSLGTGAMTLYNYLDGRAALEELVVDAVSAQIRLPVRSEDWIADVRDVATAIWVTVRAHPAAIPLILTRRTSSPASLAPAEALAEALSRSGLHGQELLSAFRAVMGFVMGTAQAELAGPLSQRAGPDDEATRIESLAAPGHPSLAALAKISRGSTPDGEFRRGLEIILTGLYRSDRSLPRHGRVLCGEGVSEGRGDIAVVADWGERPVTCGRDIAPEGQIVLAGGVEQHIDAMQPGGGLAGIWACVVDGVGQEDHTPSATGRSGELTLGEFEWERDIGQATGGELQEVVQQVERPDGGAERKEDDGVRPERDHGERVVVELAGESADGRCGIADAFSAH